MILHRVTLQNVGVFKGRQSLDLTPPDTEHPVILIGALNGGGKTTLLGALLLALYGNRAQGIERTRKGYHRHLRELINRSTDPAEGAAVEVDFERRIDGLPVHYQIRRNWMMRDGAVEENFQVLRDGEPDALLASHWDESIDSFLPARLAHLFFFDGEQIEKMADEEEATKLLASAFQSLLGLDLVARLQEDLSTLERRKRLSIRSPEDRQKLQLLEEEIKQAEGKCQAVHDEWGAINGKLTQKQNALGKLKQKFKEDGGEHYLDREKMEGNRAELASRLECAEAEFREVVAGCAPFVLVPDLLKDLLDQAELEHQAQREQIVAEAEAVRDKKVLEDIQNQLPKKAFDAVRLALEKTRPTRELLDTPRILHADEGFPDRLKELVQYDLPNAKAELDRLDVEIVSLREELAGLDRFLTAVPDEDALVRIQSEIVRTEQEIRDLTQELELKQESLRTAEFDHSLRQRAHRKEYEKHIDSWEGAEHDGRIVERIPKVKATLEIFRQKVVARHIGSLEHAIFESFQFLSRKPKLLGSIRIASDTFEMSLYDPAGVTVPFQILSAGERQLLATAILWALAKVSGRPVPLVIDTPLGRLDSHHRAHIVQRYFPAASHQVILLSTDEEIVGRYLEMLEPAIGRKYLLRFDEPSGSSVIDKHYFESK